MCVLILETRQDLRLQAVNRGECGMSALTREADKRTRIVQQKSNAEAGSRTNHEARLRWIAGSRLYRADLIGRNAANDSAWATRSLMTTSLRKPSRRRTSSIENRQELLLNLTSSPNTGPATASTASSTMGAPDR